MGAVATLVVPFAQGQLVRPDGRVGFLRAAPHRLFDTTWRHQLVCEQTWKPTADQLTAAGFALDGGAVDPFPMAMVLLTKHKRESLGNIARAWSRLEVGGTLVVAGRNNEGIRAIERVVLHTLGPIATAAKHHGRVFWLARPAGNEPPAVPEWIAEAAPRRVATLDAVTRPGIFSWERVDPGSELLARSLPPTLAGRVADLGAGWGYLARAVLVCSASVGVLDLYEAEALALDCARENVVAPGRRIRFHWHDVAAGIGERRYDTVVTNPPFHDDSGTTPELGRRFIEVAAAALVPGGTLYMVANRHLPYEQPLAAAFTTWEKLADDRGYKVLRAVR
ncbi:MAG: class I SAM-dependent methyltransferase [Alphaproteobacteria bacterium]|nr:class I SAM-dependent methyltransferase [Alphaproteobacteria bacterium]